MGDSSSSILLRFVCILKKGFIVNMLTNQTKLESVNIIILMSIRFFISEFLFAAMIAKSYRPQAPAIIRELKEMKIANWPKSVGE